MISRHRTLPLWRSSLVTPGPLPMPMRFSFQAASSCGDNSALLKLLHCAEIDRHTPSKAAACLDGQS